MKQKSLENFLDREESEGCSTLPSGWRWVRLGEVCEMIMGQSPPGDTYTEKQEGLPFFQGKADFGEYYPTVRIWCVQPIKIAEEGDILISVRAPVGPVNMNNLRCCIGRGLTAIRCKNKIINWFVFWYLRNIKKDIAALESGSTFGAITRDDLINLQIPLPPLEDQHRIASKLQELMQEIYNLKSAISNQSEAAKALPSAYLREVFESEEAKKWERKRLGDTIVFIKNGIVAEQNFDGNGFPVTRIETISNGFINSEKIGWANLPVENFTDFRLCEGDILFSHINSVERLGNCAVYEGIPKNLYHGMNLLRIKAKENILDPYFLLFWLRSDVCKNYYITNARRAIGQASLNQSDIKQIPVHLPALHIQHRIAYELKEKMAQVENLQSKIYNQQSALDALPQAILRKAFRGEL